MPMCGIFKLHSRRVTSPCVSLCLSLPLISSEHSDQHHTCTPHSAAVACRTAQHSAAAEVCPPAHHPHAVAAYAAGNRLHPAKATVAKTININPTVGIHVSQERYGSGVTL